MSKPTLIGAFVAGAVFAYTFLPHPLPGPYAEPCSADSEQQLSPHEQQDEPRLASTTKIPEDERFIF